MSRAAFLGASALLLLLAIVSWRILESSHPPEIPFETRTKPIQVTPVCPWRDPDVDLRHFFPEATRFTKETRILSGLRTELGERLGRTPTAEENSLYLYRVFGEDQPMGVVVTRRVKGEHGAIEIVLSVTDSGQVRGLRLQRLREPESIAAAIERPEWLDAFRGRTVRDPVQLGRDIPSVPAEARTSAIAIADGVRSLLILLDAASKPTVISRPHH